MKIWIDLPRRLRDPIAVFKSRTVPGGRVVLTEIEHQRENVVAALHFDRKAKFSSIRSLYPKSKASLLNCVTDDLATYYDNERAQNWLHRIAGSDSQRAWVQLRATLNVKTDDDAVKGLRRTASCRGGKERRRQGIKFPRIARTNIQRA